MASAALAAIRILARRLAPLFLALFLLISACIDLVIGVTQGYYEFYSSLVPIKRYSVVVSSVAVAPFTSAVDIHRLESELRSLGIEARVTPLDMVAGVARGRGVIVLGLSSTSWRCLYCCILSPRLARELNASRGSIIVVATPFTPSAVALRVVGIERVRGLEGFVLVPDEIARLLRGLSPSQSSLAIIECSNGSCVERVARALGARVPTKLVERLVVVAARLHLARASRKLSEVYMSRLGISRTTVAVLDIALSLVLALGVYVFSRSAWVAVEREVAVLRMLGASRRCLALSALAISMAALAAASTISLAALELLRPSISILSYPIELRVSPGLHLASVGLVALISTLGLLRGAEL